MYDLERIILNYLAKSGPCSLTDILYYMRLNYNQTKACLTHLWAMGVIELRPIKEFKRGHEYRGEIARMHKRVANVWLMTPRGHEYLKKVNNLELMLIWPEI
jgi:hypothetical protein